MVTLHFNTTLEEKQKRDFLAQQKAEEKAQKIQNRAEEKVKREEAKKRAEEEKKSAKQQREAQRAQTTFVNGSSVLLVSRLIVNSLLV